MSRSSMKATPVVVIRMLATDRGANWSKWKFSAGRTPVAQSPMVVRVSNTAPSASLNVMVADPPPRTTSRKDTKSVPAGVEMVSGVAFVISNAPWPETTHEGFVAPMLEQPLPPENDMKQREGSQNSSK
jgi:hypothetical protein